MGEKVQVAAKKPEVKRENLAYHIKNADQSQSMSSPVDQVLYLQRTIGNQAVQRLIKSGALQAKLKIGQPGDKYEQEADRVADAVMRMPEEGISKGAPEIQRICRVCGEKELRRQTIEEENMEGLQSQPEEEDELQAKTTSDNKTKVSPDLESRKQFFKEGGQTLSENASKFLEQQSTQAFSHLNSPHMQRECEECKIAPPSKEELETEKEEAEITPISRKEEDTSDGASPRASFSDIESTLKRSRDGGHPLLQDTRKGMEDRFGQDFSNVRIHTGSEAASMSRFIQAKAFTYENNIFFNEGKYNQNTKDGLQLLAHELVHVIQQTGSRPIQPRIQRESEVKIGNWAHARIQDLLRGKDNKLITEAPIPGGTRDEKKINVVGFADLYKAEEQTVSGISAQEPAESKLLEEAHKVYKYVNIRKDWKKKAQSKSTIKFGPKIKSHKKDEWDFSPNFPLNFHVGEIKPLFSIEFPQSLAYHGTGIIQTGNYIEGFEEFVKQVYRDNKKHKGKLPGSIHGRPLYPRESYIPDDINYKKFEKEHLTTGKDAILKRDTGQRLWFYYNYKNKDGVGVYFLISHPYISKKFPGKVEKQLHILDPLLFRLRQKRSGMSNTLLTKREPHTKMAPFTKTIYRKSVPGIQAKAKDWKKLAGTWENDRKNWVKGTGVEKPKKFLKEQAKGVEKKAKVDDKLGVTSSSPKIKEQIKTVEKIRFWSGFRGRILGALRFRFGIVFDKVEELFQEMKNKFRTHHENSGKLNKKGGIFAGWKKVATRAIIQFSVEILKEMLVGAFTGFVNCINGIVGAIQNKFITAVNEGKEELTEEIEPICCEIMDFKKKLEKEYKKNEKTINSFTETVETVQQWREILDDVEIAVRVGVQIVSCGTPPGLGCLWGLVAQLGISAGLSLLARTDYFEDEIAKPAARKLMDAIVGDSFHNFMVEILEGTQLRPYMDEVNAGHKRKRGVGGKSVIGGNLDKLNPNDPKIVKIREEWEKEFESQILKDLQDVFGKEKGKMVTKEDLQELVEFIQKSKFSPEEIKQLLEHARNPATGKLNLETAKTNLEKRELPKTEPKERKIDYEKATRSNEAFQEIIGWDPLKFYKKPGVKPDSKEFAEAVYDMQEALRTKKADGMLGPETVIAFYEKNKLKKDFVYQEAIRVREKKKKKEREKAESAKPQQAPAATFNLLNGLDFVIKDKHKDQNVPKSVAIYLHSPNYRELVKEPSPGDRELVHEPKLVTLDIYVSEIHIYRIQNVSVKTMMLIRIIASAGGIPGEWILHLTLKDGIQLTSVVYPDEELILRSQLWSAD